MDKRLSSESEAALHVLAREIGRRRRLDNEAVEELYGHLEDKTLGYLSGEENLSEADAVLLTREHFGDPGAFPEPEAKPARFQSPVSLPRRLAALAVLTLAVGIALSAVKLLVALGLQASVSVALFDGRNLPTISVRLALYAGVIFLVLRMWLSRERRGARLWYQDRSPFWFAWMIPALIALRWCIPNVHVDSAAFAAHQEAFLYAALHMPRSLYMTFFGLLLVTAMLPSVLWVWWADRHAYNAKTVAIAVLACIGLSAATAAITFVPSMMCGYPIYLIGDTESVITFLTSATSGAALDDALKDTSRGGFAATALALRAEGYKLIAGGSYASVAALLYLVAGAGSRILRRYGGTMIHVRPAAR